jgi:hypothetical protein
VELWLLGLEHLLDEQERRADFGARVGDALTPIAQAARAAGVRRFILHF